MLKKSFISAVLLFGFTSFFSTSLRAVEHAGIVSNFNGDTLKLSISSEGITTNGNEKPGLFIPAIADQNVVNKNQLKDSWIKFPKDEESLKLGKKTFDDARKTMPLKILFTDFKANEAAEKIATILKAYPDKFRLSFDAKSGESSYVDKMKKIPNGELKYRELQYIVPESAVTIKNLKTGEIIPFSDFIDKFYDRSFKRALTNVINGWIGKAAKEEIFPSNTMNDSKRDGFPKELLDRPKDLSEPSSHAKKQ